MISIIVPVYNVAKYLSRCLESVLAQTYTDWELLLVDDGSYDESGKICDEYAEKDTRIRVFHTPNGGVSRARNRGLDEAKGEWIAFIDPDDWWNNRCLEVCYQAVVAEQLDMVEHGRISVYPHGKEVVERDYLIPVSDGTAYIATGLQNVTVWSSLIRRDLIESVHLRFQPGLRNGEDSLFSLSLLCYCHRVKHIPDTLYYYFRGNTSSAMHTIRSENYLAHSNAYIALAESWPPVKYWTDKQIMIAVFAMVANNDVSEKVLSDLVVRANVKTPLEQPYINYVQIARFCPWLAYHYCRLGIMIKRVFRYVLK